MAKYSNTIVYNLKTNLDSKGIDSLRKKLSQVQTDLYKLKSMKGLTSNTKDSNAFKFVDNKELEESYQTILKIQKALNSASNFSTGSLNTSAFLSDLQKMEVSTQDLIKTFSTAGVTGQQAFNQMAAALGSTEAKVSRMSTTVTKMFNTFQNTLRWGITASIFETASNSIGRAVDYVKDLDRSLNDIRIISGYSAEDMNKFADSANKAAQALGKTTTEYTNASLIYIQQGKTLQESNSLAELTLKTANVTGQATAEVSEQLTSLMNGYQISVDNMEASVDKLAKVAAVSASDLEELATAESKVASTANALGVSQDQLVSQLSTIISVTRQAPESVGNAMKTIYARLGDLQLGETLEDGTTLGSIGEALDAVGVSIQTSTGDLRNMGDVIEELMGKWQDLDTAQRQALAVKLAGKYQYNNLMALLENSEMYDENLEAAQNSLGTINEQQQIYLDSLEGKLNTMQSAFEGFINSIFDVDDIKPFIDDITGLIQLLTGFTNSVGSTSLLAGAVGVGARVFSNNIGDQAMRRSQNKREKQNRLNDAAKGEKLLRDIGKDPNGISKNSTTYKTATILGSRSNLMNEEQKKYSNQLLSKTVEIENALIAKRKESETILNKIAIAYQKITGESIELKQNNEGEVENLDKALIVLQNMKNVFSDIDESADSIFSDTGKVLSELNALTNDGAVVKNKNKGLNKQSSKKMFNASISYSDLLNNLNNNEKFKDANGNNVFSGLESYKKLEEANKAFGEAVSQLPTKPGAKATKTQTEAVTNAFIQARKALIDFNEELSQTQTVSMENVNAIKSVQEEVQYLDGSLENVHNTAKGFNDDLGAKGLAASVTQLFGAIGQLVSAGSALKNLGSLFADDTATTGEKILGVIENLAFVIPMAISGYTELQEASQVVMKTLGLETEEQVKATTAKLSAKIASSELAKAEGAVGKATNIASKAVTGFGKVLNKIPQIAAVTAIVGLLSSFSQGLGEAEEELKQQKISDDIEKAKEALSDTKATDSAKDSVDELNKSYLETGEGLEDVQDAVKNLADALGASISSDDLKRESIQKTIDKLYEYKDAQDSLARTDVSVGLTTLLGDQNSIKRSGSFNQEYFDYGDWNIISNAIGEIKRSLPNGNGFLNIGNLESSLSTYIGGLWWNPLMSDEDKASNVGDIFKVELLNSIIHDNSIQALTKGGFTQGATAKQIINDREIAMDMLAQASQAVDNALASGQITDEQATGLRQGITEAENEIVSYISSDTVAQVKSLTAQKASFAVQDIVAQKIKEGVEDPQEILDEALKDSSVQEYAGLVDENIFYGWIKTLITTYLDVSGEEAEELLNNSGSYSGLVTPAMKARYGVLQIMYGDKTEEMSDSDYENRTAGLDDNGNSKKDAVEDYYSSLKAQGVSDSVIEGVGDKITKEQLDFLMQASHSSGGFVSLNDILTAIASGTQNGFTKALEHASVASSDEEARKIFEEESTKAMEEAADSAVLDTVLDSFVQKAQQEAAQTGTTLSSDEAYKQVQDELSAVLNSTLSDFEKTQILIRYFNGDIEDLSEAVSEKAIQFKSIKGLSADSNSFVQDRYISTVSNLTSNETYMSSYEELQGTVFDQANEFVSSVYSGLTDDMVSQISKISTRDDFDAVEHSVESLVTLGYSASDAWEYALEHIEDAAKGLNVDDFQNYQDLKGIVGTGRAEYYKASQGYVSGDAVKEDFTKAMEYANELGLSVNQLQDINWNQSWDKIQKDMQEMATGFDLSRDIVNDFRQNLANNLVDLDLSSSDVGNYVDELSKYDDDTLSKLEDLNLLKEENLGALLQILDAADGNGEKLLGLANQWSQEQDGSYKGLQAADNFNGDGLKKASGFEDSDKNGFADSTDELWEYAEGLGYTSIQFSELVKESNKAGHSTEEFKQRLENLTYGLDSISDKAQDAANALIRAGFSNEQTPIYDEFGTLTGYEDSDVQKMVSGWSPDTLDSMSSLGLFDKGNEENLSAIANVAGSNNEIAMKIVGFLDEDTLDQQIDELNANPKVFFMRAEIKNAQDLIQSVQDAIDSGDALDVGSVNKLYEMAPALQGVSLYSQQGKEALKELQEQLNAMDLAQLREEYDVLIKVDKSSFKSVEEYDDYVDRVTSLEREIDIKIQSNADQIIDDVSDLNAQIEDTRSLLNKDGGLINTDDYLDMIKIWPELSEGAINYGNDTIQVSQDAIDAWEQSSSDMLQTTIDEKKQELLAQAAYYQALGEAETIAAGQYANMLNDGVTNAQEAKEKQAEIEDNLTIAKAAAAGEQVDNSANANETENENFMNLANNVQGYYGVMAGNAVNSANAQIQAINSIGTAAQTVFNSIAAVAANALKGKPGGVVSLANLTSNSFSGIGATGGSSFNHSTSSTSGGAKDSMPTVEDVTRDLEKAWQDAVNNAQNYLSKADSLTASAGALDSFNMKDNNGGTGGKGGSGGGGGGDGSGSGYDPKTKEKLEDEADRYEKVNAQIDKLNNTLEQLNTEEARLVGFNRVNIIQKETENIKRQIEVYKQKLELQKQERDEVKKKLEDDFKVEFDSEGYISNYQKKFEEYLGGINYLIDQYNAETTEEGQENLEKQIENAQDAFEDFKDLISKYDELNSNTIKETEKSIQDLHDKIEDMMIDLFNKAVEAADSIKDIEDKWLDLKKAMDLRDQDDPFLAMEISAEKLKGYLDNASEASDNFFNKAINHYAELKKKAKTDEEKKFYQDRIDEMEAGKKAQGNQTLERNGSGYLDMTFNNAAMINEQIKQYNETGKSSMFGENQQALYEAAQTIYDQASDALIDFREEIDNLQEEILDGIDKIADTMDERAEVLERMTEQLDHYVSLTQTLYGESIQGYEQQEKILQAKVDLVNRELVEAHTNAEHWKQISQQFDEGTEERKKADEKAAEAITRENELLATSIETAQQLLAVQGNKAVSKWVNSLFGQDLEWTQKQWEMINRNADYYLDSVNKAYNIQKLQGQYVDLLDNTSALSTQIKITDQMNQQLEYLRKKTNLSQYDVDYAQAQLEILKQQIALEEAQANKSQMRLRRDSQGNYNYVYTANEGDVKSAQEGLLDAQNNAYNLSKDQMKQTQSDALSAIQATKQTLIDIFTDTALTIQERKDRMKEVIDSLQEYLRSTGEQLSTSQANILNDFYGMVDSLSSENSEAMLDTFDKLQSGMGDSFDKANTWWDNAIQKALNATDKIQQANETLFEELKAPLDTYNANIKNASDSAGGAIDQITTKVNGITDATGKLADSFNAVNTSIQNMLDLLQGSEQTLKDFKAKYAELVNQNSQYIRELETLRAELNEKNKETAQGGKGTTTSTSSNGSNNGKGDNSGDGKGDTNNFGGSGYSREELKRGIALAIWNYGLNSGWGNDPDRSAKLIRAYGEDFAKETQSYIDYWKIHDDNKHLYYDLSSEKFTSTNLVGYDTGGYTGDWSDGSGKLALLHSKEIVLNANDTQNILKAVESVRAMTAAMKGATLAEAVGSISSIGKSIETANSRVDQNVNITAEFPNATSADEIREAILGLNNQVLHYTHRKA